MSADLLVGVEHAVVVAMGLLVSSGLPAVLGVDLERRVLSGIAVVTQVVVQREHSLPLRHVLVALQRVVSLLIHLHEQFTVCGRYLVAQNELAVHLVVHGHLLF